MTMILDRRGFLAAGAVFATGLFVAPQRVLAGSAAADRRFLFVIQRGAADGLGIVAPYGDPDYAALRKDLAIDATGMKLDGMFALHPALVELGKMYGKGEALFVHGVASPYRDRSHFDAQNVLESGGAAPNLIRTGWLSRLVDVLPAAQAEALAVASTVPLALRGPGKVLSYAPAQLATSSDDLLQRVEELYAGDEQLHALWAAASDARALAGRAEPRQGAISIGKLAADFLGQPDGPRIAMIETTGWDTHNQQTHRLTKQLGALDALLASLRDHLGPVWAQTVVVVATEFGRTAVLNGTGGTDHGTASVAMLVGGAVKGGRVLADWPGLSAPRLHEARDLRPTLALDAVIASAAAQTFSLDPAAIARTLFPGRPGWRAFASDLVA